MLPNTMLKVICAFSSFAEEVSTDFDNIVAAYDTANQAAMACHPGPPFLVTSCKPFLIQGLLQAIPSEPSADAKDFRDHKQEAVSQKCAEACPALLNI